MESKKTEIFLRLIEDITKTTGQTEPEIAMAVGRNKGYIAQLKSRMKHGEDVPDSFVDLLRLRFATDLNEKRISRLIDESLYLRAAIDVLLKTVENIGALQKGKEVSLVSGEMQQAIKIRYDTLHEEWAKNS